MKPLNPSSFLERTIAGHIADRFWRQQRLMPAETATIIRMIPELPSDPATITGEDPHPYSFPLRSQHPQRLAARRTQLKRLRSYRTEDELALVVLTAGTAADSPVKPSAATAVLQHAGHELGWTLPVSQLEPWEPILTQLKATSDRANWTVGLIRQAIQVTASNASRNPDELQERIAAQCV